MDVAALLKFYDAAPERAVFRFHALLPVIVVFLVTTYTTVGLRFFTRKKFASLWWDDWLMALTLFFFSIFCGCTLGMFVESRGAAGIQEIPFHSMEIAVKLLLVSECFYILTMIALKLSLAVFFLRILAAQWQRLFIVIAVVTSTIFGVVYFFFAIFQCGWFTNIDTFIMRMVAGECASKPLGMAMNYTYSSLGTVSDWTCGLVPIFLIKDSNMPKRAKVLVCGLLAFASVGSVASVVRMIYLDSITVPTGSFFKNISKLAVWSTIEPGIGITVASLACLRRLFQAIFKKSKLFGSRRTNSFALSVTSNGAPSHGIARTTEIVQEHGTTQGNEKRLVSDATTLQGSGQTTRKGSVAEKSMAEEMPAYGMSDYDDCANFRDGDLEQMVHDIEEDSGSQRATGRLAGSPHSGASGNSRDGSAKTPNLCE